MSQKNARCESECVVPSVKRGATKRSNQASVERAFYPSMHGQELEKYL